MTESYFECLDGTIIFRIIGDCKRAETRARRMLNRCQNDRDETARALLLCFRERLKRHKYYEHAKLYYHFEQRQEVRNNMFSREMELLCADGIVRVVVSAQSNRVGIHFTRIIRLHIYACELPMDEMLSSVKRNVIFERNFSDVRIQVRKEPFV